MDIKEIDTPTHNQQTTISSELSLSPQEMQAYKELYDKEALLKKKQYFAALQEHNKTLINKIKEFDLKVNAQIDSISKKIVQKKRNFTPQFEQLETKPLKQKFQEYHQLKVELQRKRTGLNSLQFLMNVKRKYQIKLHQINTQILAKKKDIYHLNKIKQKSQRAESSLGKDISKVGDLDVFANQLDQLRERVRDKDQHLRMKKEEFIKVYQQSKSNKTIPVEQPTQPKLQLDPELASLKQEYQDLGRRVDILRLKKASLVDQIKSETQEKKNMERLKSKRTSVAKVSKKGITQIVKEMNQAIAEIDKELHTHQEEKAVKI